MTEKMPIAPMNDGRQHLSFAKSPTFYYSPLSRIHVISVEGGFSSSLLSTLPVLLPR